MSSDRRIRALVCSNAMYPPKGGGVISLRTVCAGLEEEGFEISTAYSSSEKDSQWISHPLGLANSMRGLWPRIWELEGRWQRAVGRLVESEKPDVVITQQDIAAPVVRASHSHSVPALVFLQGVDLLCLGSFWSGTPWKCSYRCVGCKDAGGRLWQFPFFRAELSRIREGLASADAIVSNSGFTASTLKSIWGIDSTVAFPILREPPQRSRAEPGTKILMFSPVPHKGVDIAIDVAERSRDDKFIFVGDARARTIERMRGVPNIEYVPWTSDPESVYRQAKLLMMPSLIPEGFGRGCAEAMSRGIPCLVSTAGALPETMGKGGDVVKNHHDPDEWVAAISKYSDPAYLAKKSRDALDESMRYRGSKTVDHVAAVLETLVNRRVGSSPGVT